METPTGWPENTGKMQENLYGSSDQDARDEKPDASFFVPESRKDRKDSFSAGREWMMKRHGQEIQYSALCKPKIRKVYRKSDNLCQLHRKIE